MALDQSPAPRTTSSRRRATAGSPRAAAARSTRRVASTATEHGQQVAATALGSGQEVASTAVERSHRVVATAKRDARDLAGTARDQASQVTDELRAQVQELMDEAKAQVRDQSEVQAERMAESLRALGGQAMALIEGRPDEAGALADYVQQASDKLEAWADTIETLGVEGVLEEIGAFARRRPGAFLLGAALAGFGIGRLVRANKDSGGDEDDDAFVAADDMSTARSRRAVASGR